jgi:AraC-like protein
MSSPPSDFSIVHFSTEALPARERVPMWRDFYGPLIARLDIEPLSDGPPTFEADFRVMPGLTIASVTSSPVRLERKSKHLISEDDRICLAVSLSGGGWLTHLGRELARPAGGAYLCSHCDPLDAALGQGISRFTTLSIPRRTLAAVVPRFENQFMRPIAPDTEALRLLIGYIELLTQQRLSRPSSAALPSPMSTTLLRSRSAPHPMSPKWPAPAGCARRASTRSKTISAPRSASRT